MDIKAIIILVAFANLFLGGLLFFRSKRKITNTAFAFVPISLGMWSFTLYFYERPVVFSSFIWIKIVYSIVLIAFIPSYFYFALIFPEPPKQKRKVFLPMASYCTLSLVFLYILWFTDLWIKDVIKISGQVETILGPAYLFFCIFASLFGFAWFIAILIKKYFKAKGILKMQLRYIFVGLFLCLVFVIILDAILPLAANNTRYFWLSTCGSLFAVAATIYAITRYRLMDVRLILQRSGVFLLALSIVVGLTISSIWLMAHLMNYSPNPVLMIGGAMAMALTIALFVPLRSRLQKLADKLFFKKIISYQQTLKKISDKLLTIIDLDKLISLLVETTKNTMGLERAGVLLRDNQTSQFKIQKIIGFKEENGISLVRDNFLTEHLQKTKKPLVYEELKLMIRDALDEQIRNSLVNLRDNMKRIEAVLCLPLIVKDKLEGLVVLGRKLSEDAYSREDLEILEILANQTSIAIENARLYAEVNDLKENLEGKVAEQTKSITELLGMKTELLNTISHQLRTPTTIFRSMLSMISEGDVAGAQKEQFIKDSYAAANRLLLIVDSIMEASTFEGKLPDFEFKAAQVDDIIHQSMKIFEVIAKAKRIDLAYQKSKEPLPTIMADENYLKSALNKLIDNAIWYTKEKGKVTISTEHNKQGKTISIKVQDTGIGLTQEDKDILFQKFKRGRGSKTMNVNSSGLSLFIAKSIVEGHKGTIQAKSEGEDRGSTFTMTIPVLQEI
ncbi:MAG: ATP-binding protein [bacterium]